MLASALLTRWSTANVYIVAFADQLFGLCCEVPAGTRATDFSTRSGRGLADRAKLLQEWTVQELAAADDVSATIRIDAADEHGKPGAWRAQP